MKGLHSVSRFLPRLSLRASLVAVAISALLLAGAIRIKAARSRPHFEQMAIYHAQEVEYHARLRGHFEDGAANCARSAAELEHMSDRPPEPGMNPRPLREMSENDTEMALWYSRMVDFHAREQA